MTMLLIILAAAVTMLLLAAFMGYVLGWANQAFHVEVDPRIERVDEALPGANCGGCGYVGCREYAEAVVESDEAVNLCTVGGESVATEIADILGVEVEQSWPYRPVVHCGACYDERLQRGQYDGEPQCATANLVSENSHNQDHTDNYLLPECVDIHQVQTIAKTGDDQTADERTQDTALPAKQAGAAKHSRGNRIQLIPRPTSRLSAAQT